MIARLLVAGLVAAASLPVSAAGPMRFKSATITLPTSDRTFSGGPEAEAINNNCLACHSTGMVLTQPRLSRAEWTAEVAKMIHVYKAPVDEADVPAIVEYLSTMAPQP